MLNRIDLDVVIMELKKRINALVHSNGLFKGNPELFNSWKYPHQCRELDVLRVIVAKLETERESL
jgi:hypothetical protein